MRYQLNISAQRHLTNPNAISLVGMQLAIVEGTGQGQSGTITAYRENGTYSVRPLGTWAESLDLTSQYQITYEETFARSGYRPTQDTFDAVLTAKPSDDVIVDIVPQLTQTYNAELAFDPDHNFGRNKAVQVFAGTTRSSITLTGDVVIGKTWILKLNDVGVTTASDDGNGVDYTVIAGLSTTLADIAVGLKGQIPNTYTVTVNGVTLTISRSTPFTAAFTATGSGVITPQLLFTSENWDEPQTVVVTAIHDNYVDGGDVQVFPALSQRVNTIRGPLTIDGSMRSSSVPLNDPFMLPGEINLLVPDGSVTAVGRDHCQWCHTRHAHRRLRVLPGSGTWRDARLRSADQDTFRQSAL